MKKRIFRNLTGFIVLAGIVTISSGCRSSRIPFLRRQPEPALLDTRGAIPAPYRGPAEAAPAEPRLPATGGLMLPDEPQLPGLGTGRAAIEMPAMPESEVITYEVKKGDSLWKIGQKYGVTFQELAAYNKLDPQATLKAGAVVRIPPGGRIAVPSSGQSMESGTPTTPDASRMTIPSDRKYTVKKGDSLWVIARRFGVKVADLKQVNNLTSDTIQEGKVLILPQAAKTDARTPAPATTPKATDTTVTAPPAPPTTTTQVDTATPAVIDSRGGDLPQMLDHTVMEGDTLKSIADMYLTSVEAMKKANPTVQSDMDLVPNMKILVPFND